MEELTPEQVGEELERLAHEQVSENEAAADDPEARARSRARRQRVVTLYARGVIQSGEENYHAALVMLYGEEAAHFDLAHTFARRATALGETRAWSVAAAAIDRGLLKRGQPQRFGTQLVRTGGIWSLGDVDPRVSDSLRAMYCVPPLFVQQQRAAQRQREDAADT